MRKKGIVVEGNIIDISLDIAQWIRQFEGKTLDFDFLLEEVDGSTLRVTLIALPDKESDRGKV